MKSIGLIFAGGSGVRMNIGSRPKQFLKLHGKEIIIHTIEQFENHPEIDGIVIVCIESWIDYLGKALKKFGIIKVKRIVPGGKNGQASIYNGLKAIHEMKEENSIVLVHDGVRPLITPDLISENIKVAKEKRCAISASPAIETIVCLDSEARINSITDRSKCLYAKAPQTFIFKDLWTAHNKAVHEGKTDFIDTASLMQYYGYELNIVHCSPENIKITTPSDFYIFRALYEARESSQIFGL
jgi:2-C-methyl-D-erythritol 4-phosphate cytidylyltransferase